MYQIENLSSNPKCKSKRAISKDNAIKTIVTPHKEGIITTRQLLDKYIALTSEKSLPRSLQHIAHTFT